MYRSNRAPVLTNEILLGEFSPSPLFQVAGLALSAFPQLAGYLRPLTSSSPARAVPHDGRTKKRVTLASAALCACLALASLAATGQAGDDAAGGFWTLEAVDRTGQPVPGVVLLDARPHAQRADQEAPDAGMSSLIIDQRNKRFDPFVSVSAPQHPVSFPNSDDIRHHVYSFSEGNSFERRLYRANDAEPVTFAAEGVVALGCNIHYNMQAYVLVTTDAVAGPSDDRGRIRVAGPAPAEGASTLKLWHPLLNTSGAAVALPVRVTQAGVVATLPLTWKDPQERRSKGDLESLLRRFSREDP